LLLISTKLCSTISSQLTCVILINRNVYTRGIYKNYVTLFNRELKFTGR